MWHTFVFVDYKTKIPLADYSYSSQIEQYNDARRIAYMYPKTNYWEMKFIKKETA